MGRAGRRLEILLQLYQQQIQPPLGGLSANLRNSTAPRGCREVHSGPADVRQHCRDPAGAHSTHQLGKSDGWSTWRSSGLADFVRALAEVDNSSRTSWLAPITVSPALKQL